MEMLEPRLLPSAERVKAAFRFFDAGGTGEFNEEYLVELFKILDPCLPLDELRLLFAGCYSPDKRKIRYECFLEYVLSNSGSVKNSSIGGHIECAALRRRLESLGKTCSLEVAPGDVLQFGGKRKVPSLVDMQGEPEPPLPQGTLVFVNMVKTSLEHFQDVAAASKALFAAGLVPVPHVPAARFKCPEDLQATLTLLARSDASNLLILGGNDLEEQVAAGTCAYAHGVKDLLASELASLKQRGITTVALAGHPDGHPALGSDVEATLGVLVEKARLLLASGMHVVVVSQFCFDARKLVKWLKRTRTVLKKLAVEISEHGSSRCGVTFRIGLPGPTPRKKLERIASICEVPSLFLASVFDFLDADRDGFVSLTELEDSLEEVKIARRGSKLHSLYVTHAGADGLLGRDEFSQLLVDDAVQSELSSRLASKEVLSNRTAQGPSSFVDSDGGGSSSEAVWPEDLVLSLAAYCEHEHVVPGDVSLHFFPFGGLVKTFELTSQLCNGTWPLLSE